MRSLWIVLASASPGREEEYHAWHDQHAQEVVDAVPRVLSFQRFALAEGPNTWQSAHRFLTVYWLDGDPYEVHAEIRAAASAGLTTPPDPDIVSYSAGGFVPVSPPSSEREAG